MAGQEPTIYLMNKFRLKWDSNKEYGKIFLKGKEEFLKETKKQWQLVAAFAEWPLFEDGRVVEPGYEMTQIWRLDNWQTLYRTMIELSETSWYRELGESLASEDQELLINAGVREPAPHISWLSKEEPGYTYVYEIARPLDGRNHAYLRDVNWLEAQLPNWELVWWGSQITAQPAEISIVWRVHQSANSIDIPEQLIALARDKSTCDRYKSMMGLLQTTTRRVFYPIYTEYLAQLTERQQ